MIQKISEKPAVAERIPAAERREQILAAASRVFGERGYSGATTDQVAQAAGISQPYVVRMFGTKENLFLEVLKRALDKLDTSFRAVIAEPVPEGLEREEFLAPRLGAAYVDLIEDKGILMSLMQAFIMGHDPVIGAKARSGFLSIYRLLREEAGFEAAQTADFLAHGMLMNTLVALRLPDLYKADDAACELLSAALGTKLDLVLHVSTAPENRS